MGSGACGPLLSGLGHAVAGQPAAPRNRVPDTRSGADVGGQPARGSSRARLPFRAREPAQLAQRVPAPLAAEPVEVQNAGQVIGLVLQAT
jgi:hypothetical protein